MIDLGAWMDEKYKISSELKSPDRAQPIDAFNNVTDEEQ